MASSALSGIAELSKTHQPKFLGTCDIGPPHFEIPSVTYVITGPPHFEIPSVTYVLTGP